MSDQIIKRMTEAVETICQILDEHEPKVPTEPRLVPFEQVIDAGAVSTLAEALCTRLQEFRAAELRVEAERRRINAEADPEWEEDGGLW